MEITKLEKDVCLNHGTCKIVVEITVDPGDLANFDYQGFDLFPDENIPDLLVAVGRMYSKRIKQGKIAGNRVK